MTHERNQKTFGENLRSILGGGHVSLAEAADVSFAVQRPWCKEGRLWLCLSSGFLSPVPHAQSGTFHPQKPWGLKDMELLCIPGNVNGSWSVSLLRDVVYRMSSPAFIGRSQGDEISQAVFPYGDLSITTVGDNSLTNQ